MEISDGWGGRGGGWGGRVITKGKCAHDELPQLRPHLLKIKAKGFPKVYNEM